MGRLPVAHQKGYETTYWWEIINDQVLNKLNSLTSGSKVYFPLPPVDIYFEDMIAAGKIKFTATSKPVDAEFMLIFGRPFVAFWERRTFPSLRRNRKTPVPLWGITLDSVPLLRLYRIDGSGFASTSG